MSDTERNDDAPRRSEGNDNGSHPSLLVRNLAYSVKPEQLREFASSFSQIRDVYMPLDYHSGRPRGFAFIEYLSEDDARDAIEKLNGATLEGRQISVEYAKEKRKSADEMRRMYGSSRRGRSRSPGFRGRDRDYDRRDDRRDYDRRDDRRDYDRRDDRRDYDRRDDRRRDDRDFDRRRESDRRGGREEERRSRERDDRRGRRSRSRSEGKW